MDFSELAHDPDHREQFFSSVALSFLGVLGEEALPCILLFVLVHEFLPRWD